MIRTLGIIMILGSSTAFGCFKKAQLLHRVKSLEQMILAVKIMQRELRFNFIKTNELILLLAKQLNSPIKEIFHKIYKLAISDNFVPIEKKWVSMFKKYGEFVNFYPEDLEIVMRISEVLGKFDVNEQVKSLEYFKTMLEANLSDAKLKYSNEGKINRAIAVTVGMIIVIILL